MPYCVTCGKLEAAERLRKVGLIERRRALDFPDHMFRVTRWTHKKIGFIQYLKCKLAGHNCYV